MLPVPRVESYHQLRAAVAKVGGKKELTGKNDIATEISNQCGRLSSTAIIYYNLSPYHMGCYASPEYLVRYPAPEHPNDFFKFLLAV